tara:strand:+ start:83 stop:1291 length:1209 start_codon:yes stop_codon:yes gene_type:complete
MAKLIFKSLKFEENKDIVKVKLYNIFYFTMPKSDLSNIDKKIKINKNSIVFPLINQQNAERKFNFLLQKYMPDLKNALNNKPTIYIHKNSGIPLIGSNVFGIVDRNTSIIEVKPITGCNLDCIYCSVDEGKSSKKQTDFVIEKEYLVEELKKLIKFKNIDGIEVHVGTQGEPLLYQPLLEFVKDVKKIKQVKVISINTNGLLFTKKSLGEFVKAGLNQINLSVNTLDKKKASKIANTPYDVDHIIKIAEYASKKVSLRLAPVLLDKINVFDMEEIVKFAIKIGAKLGIQNYLYYSKGRKPCKQLSWDKFFDILKKLEKKHDVRLILNEKDFNIIKTNPLPKPFKNNSFIKAKIVCNGRYKDEFIAVSENRTITVYSKKQLKIGSLVKIKIKRSKHNVFSSTI